MISESTSTLGPDPLAGDDIRARNILLVISALACTLLLNNFIEKRGLPIPQAVVTICIGIGGGAIAEAFGVIDKSTFVEFEDSAAREFMLLFLAPIIFAEGYGLKSKQFLDNLTRIFCHAFLGTLVACLFTAFVVYYLPPLTGLKIQPSLVECLTFGAFISSTDPVTTLAVFKEQHMVENGLGHLYYTVLGESILNDAVGITLFESFSKVVKNGDVGLTAAGCCDLVIDFFSIFFGSLGIGVLCGLCSALLLKLCRLTADGEEHVHFNVPEMGVMLVFAYLPYLIADALDYSGIVAIMFTGITMRHYAHHNLTKVTRLIFLPFMEFLASICETYVFLLLGFGVFLLDSVYSISLIGWSLLACLVSRALHVYGFSFIINRISASRRLRRNEQHLVALAGLRGAVAFVCAISFPETETTQHRDVFLSTTIVIIGLSIVFLGWPTPCFMQLLDIKPHTDSRIVRGNEGALAEVSPETGTLNSYDDEMHMDRCCCTRRRTSWMAAAHSPVMGRLDDNLKRLLMVSDARSEREPAETIESIVMRSSHRPSAPLGVAGAGLSSARPSDGLQPRPSDGMQPFAAGSARPSAGAGEHPSASPFDGRPSASQSDGRPSASGRPSAGQLSASGRMSLGRRSIRSIVNP